MGLIVQIKNIQSPNNFKLFYRTGRTPGSSSEQSSSTWGTQYTGGTSVSGVFSAGTTTITIDLMEPTYLIDSNPYGKQYWFKILDLVTGSYIIENIYIHDISFYTELCATPTPTPTPTATPDCTFTGGSAVTDAPTPTPTSTIIIDCTFTGGSALVGPTPTPTTPPPTPTSTSVPPTATVPPPTPTPTSTLNDCIEITEELLFEDLGCGPGVRNRYLEYTITYKVNGVTTPAPQNITFTVNTDQDGTTTYTETLLAGQSTTTLTGVYTLVWIGETCLNKNSESYSVTSTGLTPSYEICTVVPPPTPTPTPTQSSNTTWYFNHGAGTSCTASYLEILRNGSQVVLATNTSGGSSGVLTLSVGDQLVIRVNTGNQSSPTGCSNAYVKYDSQQLVEDPQTGFNNAEINVTVTQLDINFGITICGTIGGGICPI